MPYAGDRHVEQPSARIGRAGRTPESRRVKGLRLTLDRCTGYTGWPSDDGLNLEGSKSRESSQRDRRSGALPDDESSGSSPVGAIAHNRRRLRRETDGQRLVPDALRVDTDGKCPHRGPGVLRIEQPPLLVQILLRGFEQGFLLEGSGDLPPGEQKIAFLLAFREPFESFACFPGVASSQMESRKLYEIGGPFERVEILGLVRDLFGPFPVPSEQFDPRSDGVRHLGKRSHSANEGAD